MKSPERPIRWTALRADEAERIVRRLAADTARVGFSEHAFERIEERSITQVDVYRILRTGGVEGLPEPAGRGDWKVLVTKRLAGSRRAGAVTLILGQGKALFVKTVEWMDRSRG
jgi:hypothetical protein